MKVAILSESPSLATGFGVVCAQLVTEINSAGHQIACFGIGAFGETFDRSKFPCSIWAVGHSDLIPAFCDFLSYERPDALLISADIFAVDHWTKIARAIGWQKPIIAHFVVDGLPLDRELFEFLTTVYARITPTHVVAEYLKSKGINEIIVAPHGLDSNLFKPLPHRDELRQRAGLAQHFVIGIFGRNNERKQQPRIMMALSILKKCNQAANLFLYLHCQPLDDEKLGGWNLKALADTLGIQDMVSFPERSFEQLSGVPRSKNKSKRQIDTKPQLSFHGYDYVERLNCCDLIINSSFCGGFELGIIEAQACGVPIAVTDDGSIMREVAGAGAYLLEPSDIGVWRTGAHQYFVAPTTIASAIRQVQNDMELRQRLRNGGFENAKKYMTTDLGEVVNGILATIRTTSRKKGGR